MNAIINNPCLVGWCKPNVGYVGSRYANPTYRALWGDYNCGKVFYVGAKASASIKASVKAEGTILSGTLNGWYLKERTTIECK